MNSPAQIAEKYAGIAEKKVAMSFGKTLVLAILAGAFIALAGIGCTISPVTVASASVAKLLGASIFPAGLVMVVIAGSELFTGNNLLVLPLLEGRVRLGRVLRNWGIVYLGNLIGAVAVAFFATYGGTFALFDKAAAASIVSIGQAKVSLTFLQAFLKGLLCNFLVCIAVWMAFAAESVPGKVMVVFFPIMMFVLCGYEHSIANMYFIPAAIFTADLYGMDPGVLGWGSFLLKNLLPVTLGNLVGGGVCVAGSYWFVYGKRRQA